MKLFWYTIIFLVCGLLTLVGLTAETLLRAVEPTPDDITTHSDIIAYYGHPADPRLGILGEEPIDIMTEQLFALAKEYDDINGARGVIPAFHIIFAVANPDASVSYISAELLLHYINYAHERDILVFLDHQLGATDMNEAIRSMLPYLRYGNVHLSIDPEWATETPGKELGSVSAVDINLAQSLMHDFIVESNIPGKRILIFHQFRAVMVKNPRELNQQFGRVSLIQNADGFGPPKDKYGTWYEIIVKVDVPLKGMKLFYKKDWRSWGYDDPLLSPEEVLLLTPRPVLIMYQ